jgi:4,5-DOPA dioxygenase extradiol
VTEELMPAAFIDHGTWSVLVHAFPNADIPVTRLDAHRDFPSAVPTPDHFLPLLYLAGLASAGGESAGVLIDGYTYGSLSMTAYTIGMACPSPGDPADGAAGPAPAVPPDASNI